MQYFIKFAVEPIILTRRVYIWAVC